jgi:hypothetical protein
MEEYQFQYYFYKKDQKKLIDEYKICETGF